VFLEAVGAPVSSSAVAESASQTPSARTRRERDDGEDRSAGPVLSPEQVAHVRRLGVPRLLLTRGEAAAALGMSVNSLERHVQPHVRCVRKGSMRLFPIRELERWVEENAMRVL
jgi:hypothetical protein